MSVILDPRVSQFSTDEAAASYDRWLQAKVQKAIDSEKPRVPHDQVMAEMRALLDAKRDSNNAHRVD